MEGGEIFTMPAGRYRVADPRDVLARRDYRNFVTPNAEFAFVAETLFGRMAAFPAPAEECDCGGHLVSAESGLLAVIPEMLVDGRRDAEAERPLGFTEIFTESFPVGIDDDGTAVVGKYVVEAAGKMEMRP